MKKRFILVTGHPRSGTTFVGKMLALPQRVQYMTEPFNPHYGISEMDNFYTYIKGVNDDHNQKYIKIINDFFIGKADFKEYDPKDSKSIKQYMGRKLFGTKNNYEYFSFFKNPVKTVGLIKDPTMCLNSFYLSEYFDIKTLILVRHPASVIASAKRLNMNFLVQNLVDNKNIYNHCAKTILKNYNYSSLNITQRHSLHWLIINKILFEQSKQSKNIILSTHEEISNNPFNKFHELYNFFDLPYSKRVSLKINSYTNENNPAVAPNNEMHYLKRDSKTNLNSYRKILTNKEISQIKEITYDFASNFYDNHSWT